MDSSGVINALASLMRDGATTTGILVVALALLAGTLVVWVKL